MKKLIYAALCILGCGCSANISPFSPDVHSSVSNNGQIDAIKTNTNGIMADVGHLKNQIDAQGAQIRDIQEGLFNLNMKFGGNTNSGVQILSGDGGLLIAFFSVIIGLLLFYFYKEKKANTILATEIRNRNDTELHASIIKAAAYTNVEKKIYNLIYKNRSN